MTSVDLQPYSLVTVFPAVYDYKNCGTAAGTTTVQSFPGYLHAITMTQRAASGKIIIYDSAGTSGTVIGTITCGTQVFSDANTWLFDVRTLNGLTIANDANVGVTVSFGK